MGVSISSLSAAAYGTSAALYACLGLLLLFAWRGRPEGGLLLAAVGVTFAWCIALVALSLFAQPPMPFVLLLEMARNATWLLFLLRLFALAGGTRSVVFRAFALVCGALVLAQAVVPVWMLAGDAPLPAWSGRTVVLSGLLVAVAGLALLEQLLRSLEASARWALKFLGLGVGGLFAFDIYLYADALLFSRIDSSLVAARGVAQGMIVPLLAVAAVRNPQWSVPVFVSRQVVFHSATLLGAGLYLVLMSAVGFWIKTYGGTWGSFAQTVFLFGALVLLAVLMLSGQLRARARVFLAKHFYRNRYDYRSEWLRFSAGLSETADDVPVAESLVSAVATIVESPSGVLWARRRDDGPLREAGRWHLGPLPAAAGTLPVEVERFLNEHGWVVFVDEWRRLRGSSLRNQTPVREALVALPLDALVDMLPDLWVLVPLTHGERLLGVIGLTRSGTKRDLNWEDGDLLRTVGRQAGGHLALWATGEALGDARQFEAYNRLSAFVVHDLKNLAAQLELLQANAARFRHEPAFVDDAFATVGQATVKLRRMLTQLRSAQPDASAMRDGRGLSAPLAHVLATVAANRASATPAPDVADCDDTLAAACDGDALEAVLTHLVHNAQDATPASGKVSLSAAREGERVLIRVTDTGSGMDEDFVRQRLFRPFDTTKGNAGMGVGAYQSRDFAERHGGSLEVRSVPGEGSQFSLRLPLAATTAGDATLLRTTLS